MKYCPKCCLKQVDAVYKCDCGYLFPMPAKKTLSDTPGCSCGEPSTNLVDSYIVRDHRLIGDKIKYYQCPACNKYQSKKSKALNLYSIYCLFIENFVSDDRRVMRYVNRRSHLLDSLIEGMQE